MVVGIHQLHYLPWLRYFHKIASADIFIVLDDVQYNKNGFQNRNRIYSPHGDLMLTVPVFDRFAQPLDEVAIDNKRPWARKHWRSIEQHYHRAPYFARYAPALADFYRRQWERLNELNRAMLPFFLDSLRITTPIVYASELHVSGNATARLVDLVRAVQGTAYLTGAYALDAYLDPQEFQRANIQLITHTWLARPYPQFHAPFTPDLSIIDLLMHGGPHAREVLLGTAQHPAQ